MRLMMPSALRLDRCFSTALVEIPILSASATAQHISIKQKKWYVQIVHIPLNYLGGYLNVLEYNPEDKNYDAYKD
jgi:hypothetical protein